jgi:hypothetical protein
VRAAPEADEPPAAGAVPAQVVPARVHDHRRPEDGMADEAEAAVRADDVGGDRDVAGRPRLPAGDDDPA